MLKIYATLMFRRDPMCAENAVPHLLAQITWHSITRPTRSNWQLQVHTIDLMNGQLYLVLQEMYHYYVALVCVKATIWLIVDNLFIDYLVFIYTPNVHVTYYFIVTLVMSYQAMQLLFKLSVWWLNSSNLVDVIL